MAPLLRVIVGASAVVCLAACGPKTPGEPSPPDAGPGPGGTSTVREPTPVGAVTGPVASMGTPFDPRDDLYTGPRIVYPDARPRLVAVPGTADAVDVAWLDTGAPQIVLSHIVPKEDGYAIAWHLKLETLDQLAGFARDEDGNRYWVTTRNENELQHQTEPSQTHRDGVARLFKIAPNGDQLYKVEVRDDVESPDALPLVAPMSFGEGRLAVG
ncbi:MAG: hypothetical protein IRZ16_16805, partial [Myxococcaceae bacterium]|nr:hypothetical protein [Myxococcaceae bacterium]